MVLYGIPRFTIVKVIADIPEILQYLRLKLHTIAESISVSSVGRRTTAACCGGPLEKADL
jgi:hypothetical protein